MTIKLYTNTSPADFVTKSITQVGTDLTGYQRESTTILNPDIMIEAASIPSNVNYAYITEFGRYYFVGDIETVRNGLYRLPCRVDALSTWATQLKACKGIVHRAESQYNTYLDDGSFKAYANPHVITMDFPTGFYTSSYILAIAGSNSST